MLTLFATPKSFEGHTGLIQSNAIASWMALRPAPEIILFGDDDGTAEICRELGLTHVPMLERTQFGAPLLPDLFAKAQRLAANDVLSYVNADIILLPDFIEALNLARRVREKFLMVARVWRVRIDDCWNFQEPDCESKLRAFVRERGRQSPPPGNSDFFAFPRGLWSKIPDFGIGRGAWDPWLVYEARRLGAAVVDASPFVMAVHQNHDQSTYPHGLKRWKREMNHNYGLIGENAASFCLYDATHVIDSRGIQRSHGLRYLSRRIDTLPEFHPALAFPLRIPKAAIAGARRVRQQVALNRHPASRLLQLVRSKLPGDGITAILGLADSAPGGATLAPGLQLAASLLMGGYPVVVYDPDPSAVEAARRAMTGPVEFAESAESCVQQGDVVVITSTDDELRRIALARQPESTLPAASHRVVIDCCNAAAARPGRLETAGSNVEYIRWADKG